jgi:hypothetical protein
MMRKMQASTLAELIGMAARLNLPKVPTKNPN